MIRPRTRGRCAGRIEVGDLFRTYRVTDVEYPQAGIEIPARERRRVMPVVDAAVVAAVGEDCQAHEVGEHLGTVGGVVYLQCQPRHDLRVGLVADVDDPCHRERRKSGRARGLPLGRTVDTARTRFIDKDYKRLAADLDVDRVLCGGAILPQELTDQPRVRIGYTGLNLAKVINK